MPRSLPSLALLAALAGGCARTVNTLPPLARPDAPVREHLLEMPPGLEIRSVAYDAALFSDVTGFGSAVGASASTTMGGRAFVKVYAVERATGEHLLLVYENVAERRRPIQILRFRPDPGGPARE